MQIRNRVMVGLLALTLAGQGLAWDDNQKKDNRRKFIVAGIIAAGVVAATFGGYKAWKHFDLSEMFKKKVVDKEEYIGIDLGTSKSGGGRGDELVADDNGITMTASAVRFDADGKVVEHGDTALGKDGTITSSKRIIGAPRWQAVKGKHPWKVVADTREGMESLAAIETVAGDVSPETVAKEVIEDVKQRIEKGLGKEFKKAVITVPAYFYDFQKAATKRAAIAAGFDEVVLINEPTAAAFAHGAAELDKKKLKRGVKYLIYDFGGGTMDVSIVDAKLEGKKKTFTVTAIEGNPSLGGDDIDRKIAEKLARELLGSDLDNLSPESQRAIIEEAEKAKIHLATIEEAEKAKIHLGTEVIGTYVNTIRLAGKDVEVKLSYDDFNEEIKDIVEDTLALTRKAVGEGDNEQNIDEVVLVGGSSRNLLVQKKLGKMFGKDKLKEEIDPDEVVARGAARYAKFLDGEQKEFHLSDVVPMDLRVDMKRGNRSVSKVVIHKLADTPADGDATGEAVATDVVINIRQGESEIPSENMLLGRIDLEDIGAGNDVEVVYSIDTNGILTVTAYGGENLKPKVLKIDMSKTPDEIDMEDGVEEENPVLKMLGEMAEELKITREALEAVLKEQQITRQQLEAMGKERKDIRKLLETIRVKIQGAADK